MKNRVIKFIGNLMMIASLIFVVHMLLSYEIDFSRFFTWSFLGLFVIITLLFGFTTFLGSQNWRLWLELFSVEKLGKVSTFQVFAKSNLGKYLPGNVMHYVNRQIFCRSLGIKQSEIASASVLEVLSLMLVAFILGMILAFRPLVELLIRYTLPQINLFLVIVGLIVGVLFLIVLFIKLKDNSQVKHMVECIKRPFFLVTFSKVALVYTFMYLLTGGMLYLLIAYDIPLGWEPLIVIMSASIISFVIGFITPGVPAGIGVREAVLLFFLAGIAPEYIVITAIIFQRFANIIGEVLAWLLSEILLKQKMRTEGKA